MTVSNSLFTSFASLVFFFMQCHTQIQIEINLKTNKITHINERPKIKIETNNKNYKSN